MIVLRIVTVQVVLLRRVCGVVVELKVPELTSGNAIKLNARPLLRCCRIAEIL